MAKILGVKDMRVEFGHDIVPTIELTLVAEPGYDARILYETREWDDLFPGNVIVRCQFCSQWGATKTACKHCGGAIE